MLVLCLLGELVASRVCVCGLRPCARCLHVTSAIPVVAAFHVLHLATRVLTAAAMLQVLTSCADSFAHGANDVGNAVGPFAAIFAIYQQGLYNDDEIGLPEWILVIGGVGIVLGALPWRARLPLLPHNTLCSGCECDCVVANWWDYLLRADSAQHLLRECAAASLMCFQRMICVEDKLELQADLAC